MTTQFCRNFTIRRGETLEIKHWIFDRTKTKELLSAREDLTGSTLKLVVWPDRDGTGPETFNITSPVGIVIDNQLVAETKGICRSTVPSASTKSIAVQQYHWELIRTAAGGNRKVVDAGLLDVEQELDPAP